MERAKIYTVIGMVVLGLCFSSRSTADEAKEAAALAAAKTWLGLVDVGEYGESWETAATYFKSTVTKDYWQQALPAVRKLFGEPISRKLGSITYTQSLPAAPEGEYVVIEIATTFENKKHAIETVHSMLDSDGEWRVSGYFIKQAHMRYCWEPFNSSHSFDWKNPPDTAKALRLELWAQQMSTGNIFQLTDFNQQSMGRGRVLTSDYAWSPSGREIAVYYAIFGKGSITQKIDILRLDKAY